ncbi:hypothetical protein [Aquabacter spiritensis]|uniref:Uncharacterized protein n=1 Tax=Aquabacter spiritensis TaxID=933073 RepID=A0A4R3M765_9HYPH|nr:hypothetical protein [Aquabacter spiritensis]TCT08099.1 hypothetical protein EDC64_101619 [Aquabacter spiritensis]
MRLIDLVERMAEASHMAARDQYPLLEPWDRLSGERRAYQRHLMATALAALTTRDVLGLVNCIPELVTLPAEPSPFALAELQEAAIGDNGTLSDAKRRYRSLLSVAAHPLRRSERPEAVRQP